MISAMSEEIAGRRSLTRLDGMGSRTQVELLIPTIKSDSSTGETGGRSETAAVKGFIFFGGVCRLL